MYMTQGRGTGGVGAGAGRGAWAVGGRACIVLRRPSARSTTTYTLFVMYIYILCLPVSKSNIFSI